MAAFALRNGNRSVAFEMNVTPRVDVMLVLLVIFMLAMPLTTHRLALTMSPPCAANCPVPAEPIRLAIERTGELYWNGSAINRSSLAMNLAALAQRPREPAVGIRVEASTRYALLTDVLAAAHNAGVRQIGIAPVRD
jgi:biopolymer transport protein ExbD